MAGKPLIGIALGARAGAAEHGARQEENRNDRECPSCSHGEPITRVVPSGNYAADEGCSEQAVGKGLVGAQFMGSGGLIFSDGKFGRSGGNHPLGPRGINRGGASPELLGYRDLGGAVGWGMARSAERRAMNSLRGPRVPIGRRGLFLFSRRACPPRLAARHRKLRDAASKLAGQTGAGRGDQNHSPARFHLKPPTPMSDNKGRGPSSPRRPGCAQ
jgi:hypothetical protein